MKKKQSINKLDYFFKNKNTKTDLRKEIKSKQQNVHKRNREIHQRHTTAYCPFFPVETPGRNDFSWEFYKTFKIQILPMQFKLV